jgi:hypothetical protein
VLADRPPAILARTSGQFIGRYLDQTLSIWVWDPVSRGQNFCHPDRLYAVEVFVVVDLAVDLLLNNLVCMRLDHFVGDS